jgi:LPS export ABC transporter protein LptC
MKHTGSCISLVRQPGGLPNKAIVFFLGLTAWFVLSACSFDYGAPAEEGGDLTLLLREVEYVRINQGNPEVQLRAEEIRRYEKKHTMEVEGLSFEQFNAAPEGYEEIPGVNARGAAAFARLETDTHNFFMKGDVVIEVNSEDITMEAAELSWKDAERILTVPGKLHIARSDGTTLTGTGFSADIRRRTWEFDSSVEGTVVDEEETAAEKPPPEGGKGSGP